MREAVLALPKRAWKAAIDQDGRLREGAWVAELTAQVDMSSWPAGTRLICRRERPHPGAQLSFSDIDGHRFQCFITDQAGNDIAALEVLHRQHAWVEDRISELRSTGLSKLPFGEFQPNEAWLELAVTAHTLTAWTQALLLDDEHAICEPKRLSYRLLHVAGKLTRHARRNTLPPASDRRTTGATSATPNQRRKRFEAPKTDPPSLNIRLTRQLTARPHDSCPPCVTPPGFMTNRG